MGIGKALEANTTLIKLGLGTVIKYCIDQNKIGNAGAIGISKGLKNSSLTTLGLGISFVNAQAKILSAI